MWSFVSVCSFLCCFICLSHGSFLLRKEFDKSQNLAKVETDQFSTSFSNGGSTSQGPYAYYAYSTPFSNAFSTSQMFSIESQLQAQQLEQQEFTTNQFSMSFSTSTFSGSDFTLSNVAQPAAAVGSFSFSSDFSHSFSAETSSPPTLQPGEEGPGDNDEEGDDDEEGEDDEDDEEGEEGDGNDEEDDELYYEDGEGEDEVSADSLDDEDYYASADSLDPFLPSTDSEEPSSVGDGDAGEEEEDDYDYEEDAEPTGTAPPFSPPGNEGEDNFISLEETTTDGAAAEQ